MFKSHLPAVKDFRRHEDGTIAITFGVMFMMIVLCMGVAVDYARLHHSYSRLTAAADAAAIAAGKGLLDGRLSIRDIEQMATEFFYANLKEREGYATIHSFRARVNRAQKSVEVDVEAEVPMTIMKVAGFDKVDIPVTSVAIFDQKDIEVSLALDLTGSMCEGGDRPPCLHGPKIDGLKRATNDLIDILLPPGPRTNSVRIALAPYSSGVNIDASLVRDVTGVAAIPRNCTFERESFDAETDIAPGTGTYLRHAGDGPVPAGALCPTNAAVVPLSDDPDALKRVVDRYRADGSTAGHLGAQWGWYLLSQNWGRIFGGTAPAAYNDGRTVKAMMLMTDGVFNTVDGINGGDVSARATDSQNRARETCADMRTQGIKIFTIGFKLADIRNPTARANAAAVLRDCAGSNDNFYNADNEAALRQAFSDIAQQINNLRISK